MTLVWPNGGTTPPVDYRKQNSGFRWTSPFGMRTHPVTQQPTTMHYGIDLIGWPTIKAPTKGVITFAGYNGAAGNEVRMRADGPNAFIKGDVYRMLHNRVLYVKTGQRVEMGQNLAEMGTTGSSTGVHCHFETRPGGGAAVEPLAYMRARIPATSSGGGSKPLPGGTPTPIKRRRKKMSTGVIYTKTNDDKKRRGAIVNTESGFVSLFGWFHVGYANGIAVGFGLEKAAEVSDGSFDAIVRDARATATRNGALKVDIADEDVPKIGA